MKKIYFVLVLCCFSFLASATRYFPSSATAPYGGTAQNVCQGAANTATTINYAVCGTTSGTAAQTLTVTPTWYLNGAIVYTGAQFVTTAGGGTITLPAAAFTYTTVGTFNGANGLKCTLNWPTAAPGACAASLTVTGTSTNVTVTATPGTIVGATSVCTGGTISLTDSPAGGTWSSSTSAVATVVAASGVVRGVTTGTTVIRYQNGCGAAATSTVSVLGAPGPIAGGPTLCGGLVTALSDAAAGGAWSSSNTNVATFGSAFGAVTGGIAGTVTITYSTGCGAPANKTFTVIATPGVIVGPSSVCVGSTIALTDAPAGGTWSSSTSSVATVVAASGVVRGVVAGSTTIKYSNGCGTGATATVTVLTTPVAISGLLVSCDAASTTTLSDAVAGGTWSSSNTSVASVDVNLGVVTSGVAGTTTITYSTGCGAAAVKTFTVLTTPGAISGTSPICAGVGTSFTDPISGGTWSSDNTAVATVGSATGLVTGGVAGTANITYSTGCGTAAATSVSVTPLPGPIAGVSSLCAGFGTTLSDAVSGGVWSSGNSSVATIDPALGIITTGIAGNTTISYSTGCSPDAVLLFTVNPQPQIAGPVLGATTVCQGALLPLSDAVSSGAWSSSNTAAAQIGASGVVIGIAGGTATISYLISNICGSTLATSTITVDPLPAPAAITGYTSAFCAGSDITLSDATPGGSWSSNITAIATAGTGGVIHGVSGGNTTIYYSVTNGCGTVPASVIVTVDSLPVIAAIAGSTHPCVGSSVALSDATAGGTWTSTATAVAIVGSATGVVNGIVTGTATVSYSMSNACGAFAATALITVDTLAPTGIITGRDTVCQGFTTALSDSIAGGIWSSDLPSTAVITSSGNVYGVAAGNSTIRYTITNHCGSAAATLTMHVLPATSAACAPAGVPAFGSNGAELKVFPNPNTGTFTVNLLSDFNEPVQVIITNVVGEKVIDLHTASNRENTLKLNKAGIYFVSTVTARGTNVVKIVIAN